MRLLPLLALFSSLLYLAGCAGTKAVLPIDSPYRDPTTLEKGQIVHLKTGRLLTEAELFDYLSPYRVIYVGESHDNADDHAVQLSVIRAMEERFPGKVAVGMEMLKRPFQAEVDDYVQGNMEEKEFLRVWQKNWQGDAFLDYRDILHFAREKKIPVVALNTSDEVKADVKNHVFKEMPAETAKELPEIDLEDPYHRAFAEGMMGGHGAGTGDSSAFYRVMLLWDETMAQTAADYLKKDDQGRRLVVLAGGNHVRYGIGIPRRVFRRVPLPYVIVEPYANPAKVEIPADKKMEVDLPELPMPEADVLWSVGYRVLDEPKVMLGVQIDEAGKKGVKIVGVMPESPALKAGVQKDDIIVSVDGVEVKEPFDLTYQVKLHKPGDVGPLELLRGEQKITLQVTYDIVKHAK